MPSLIDDSLGILAGKNELEEFMIEAGRLQAKLTIVFVNVEESALRPRFWRRFGFVDRRLDSVQMQNAC
jgi:hypothetical protein